MEHKHDLVSEKPGAEKKFETKLLYSLIGIASSLALALILYWSLDLNSSITMLIQNTKNSPLYLWLYSILTLGTIILFGINSALFAKQWRRFGPPKMTNSAGTALGGILGVFASACPTCGSILLSSIGIAGGLAAFPLQGIELKGISFALVALPVWLSIRNMRKKEIECANGTCPAPLDDSIKSGEQKWIGILFVAIFMLGSFLWGMLKNEPFMEKVAGATQDQMAGANFANNPAKEAFFAQIQSEVIPENGFQSKISLKDSVLKLVEYGVIDTAKWNELYKSRGGMPSELATVLEKESRAPIHLTKENAAYYINLLWPLGLANHIDANRASPVNGPDLFNFASTGGWGLGKEKNGGAYFNKFEIVKLTSEQESLVKNIAENTYRPCCDNSTFFQDCNHGSALLGLLELGAAQGLSEDELYREALAFNSFWFSETYIQTAIYFKSMEGTDWKNVDPKRALSAFFSSGSGWYKNVYAMNKSMNLLPPQTNGGGGCGA